MRERGPRNTHRNDVVSALIQLVNIKRINLLSTIVVEIICGDGRVYANGSLLFWGAGLVTSYDHDSGPPFNSMKDHSRERLLDPGQYLPGPRIGTLPHDATNYLRETLWQSLAPGVRTSTGSATNSGTYVDAVQFTTCGILFRNQPSKCVTVAKHGFPASDKPLHLADDRDKIGEIVDRYPELGIAMGQLTPAQFSNFSNQTYVQIEPPKRLAGISNLVKGTWFEVDGISTAMILFQYLGNSLEMPVRPPGHPKICILDGNTIPSYGSLEHPARN